MGRYLSTKIALSGVLLFGELDTDCEPPPSPLGSCLFENLVLKETDSKPYCWMGLWPGGKLGDLLVRANWMSLGWITIGSHFIKSY